MNLNFVESGNLDGETIVFLHGAGMATWSWHEVIGLLPQYHTIAVDLPGHGESNHIQAESLAEMGNIVADFIANNTPNGKAHVVGLSLGGISTLEMMIQRPELVQSAVISGVNAIPMSFMTKMMVRVMQPLMKNDFFIQQNAKMFQLDERAAQAYFTSMKQLDMTTFKHIIPEIMDYEPAGKLSHVDVPTLFVAGGAEDPINVKSVSLLADAIPNASGVLAPDLHHGWSGENPELFAEMVNQWVSSNNIADGLDVVVDKRVALELA